MTNRAESTGQNPLFQWWDESANLKIVYLGKLI
jgi:hypothetical protein